MNEFATVATFFKEGGIFMYFMLATAVVVIAIVAERFIVIRRASGLDSDKLVTDLARCLEADDLAGARECARTSQSPAARVAEAILRVRHPDVPRMQAAADDAATLALPPLSRRLPHLNVLANVATLLGLLGTISGLITAFSAVGAADPAQRSAFMARGISTALNATAFGLIIAIPTLILQGMLAGMVERVAEQVDEISIRLTNLVSERQSERTGAHVVALPATGPADATRPGIAAQGGARWNMSSRAAAAGSVRNAVNCDLELRPLMNVFIVLIPMLLMSAVFMEIRVIEMSPPPAAGTAASQSASVPLELSLRVRGDSYVVTGNGISPMTFARPSAPGKNGELDAATAESLTRALSGLAAAYPANHEIRIVAESRTRYQEIVSLMDLARAAGLPEAALVGSVPEGA